MIGKVGSFAVDTPLQRNYVSDALTDTENQGFRYKAERRAIADAKKADEEAKAKVVADEFDSFDKSLIPTITGYSSIDDPISTYATDVKQKGVDWIRQKNQERDPYKKAEIQSKINKATQSFKTLNQYPALLNSKKAELEEGIKAGKYNERDLESVTELAKSLDSGKYDMRVDENGVPRMTIYKVDENGSPVGVLEKGISLGDLTNRITPMNKPTYDINNGIAEQIVSQVKLDTSKVQNGFTTITKEQMSKRVDDALQKKAQEVATMPSEAYELWQKMGNSPKRTFSDADKQQISDYVYKDLKSRYKTNYEKAINQGDALNDKKFKAEQDEKKTTLAQAEVSPNILNNYKPMNGYKAVVVENAKPIKSLRIVINGQPTELNNAQIKNYTIIDNGKGERQFIGEVTYDTYDIDAGGNSVKTTATKVIPLNESDALLLLGNSAKGKDNKEKSNYLKNQAKDPNSAYVTPQTKKVIQFDAEGNIIN